MLKGKQLRLLRQTKEIKAKYIAEQLRVTNGYISILESERQSIPTHIYEKWIRLLKGDVE